MTSLDLSKNESFYQLASHTTDTFTSCIMIYEALLPYFKGERPGGGVNKRLFNIGGMLTILYSELNTLKNEITTADVAVGDNDIALKPRVESRGLKQVVSECNEQENIICEASTVEQNVFQKEKVLDKLPKRSWEDVIQVPGEEYLKERANNEDSKTEQTISHDEKVHPNPNENLKKQACDFGCICGNCNEAITVYNQDLDLSVALHNQDGCCRGEPSKLIAAQKESQDNKVNVTFSQGQAQNPKKYQEATNRRNLTPVQLGKGYTAGGTHFSCIQSLGNGFICTVCNKKLAGPKNFVEHVTGFYHQSLLNEVAIKEVQVNTGHRTNVTYAQSPTSITQQEIITSLNAELAKIIKRLSGPLRSQRQYLSVAKGIIMCNLCDCQIPPTFTNVKDHVLGSRHSKNQTEM